MKECSKCKENKDLTEFNKHKTNKDGLKGDCKVCAAANQKEWYKKNKEVVIAKNKEYYKKLFTDKLIFFVYIFFDKRILFRDATLRFSGCCSPKLLLIYLH